MMIYQAVVTIPCPNHGFHSLWMSSNDDDDLEMYVDLLARALQTAGITHGFVFRESDAPEEDATPRDREYRECLARALGVNTDQVPF